VDENGTVGFGPDNRHAECTDCHNPHTIGGIMPETNTIHYRGPTIPRTGAGQMIYGGSVYGSDCLQGVWGVMPTQWGALGTMSGGWTEWKPPAYPNGAEYEAQICFKCHSTYGGASRDIASEINPHNNSGHPIARIQNESGWELSGRPPLIPWTEINPPWLDTGNTRMYCTDCHGNDAGVRPEGVHGSSKPSMLRAEPGTDRHYWITTDTGQWFRLNNRSQQWHIDKLFCLNCHVLNANLGHTGSWHQGYACTHCHAPKIHGGWNYGERLTIFNSGLWMVGQPCHPVCGK
jgi:hypothetical protein